MNVEGVINIRQNKFTFYEWVGKNKIKRIRLYAKIRKIKKDLGEETDIYGDYEDYYL
jgi:hypothetical protein